MKKKSTLLGRHFLTATTLLFTSLLAPLAFAQTPTFAQQSETILLPSDFNAPSNAVDLNGDGRDDWVSLSVVGYPSLPAGSSCINTDKVTGQLKVVTRLNRPDGTYAPAEESLLPLVIQGTRFNGGTEPCKEVYFELRRAVKFAKITPGSNDVGMIISGIEAADGLNLNYINLNIAVNNTATLKSNGDGTFALPVITRGFAKETFTPADLSGAGYQAHLVDYSKNPNGSWTMLIYNLNADGSYTLTPSVELALPLSLQSPSAFSFEPITIAADLNNDGKDELILRAHVLDRSFQNGVFPVEKYAIYVGGGSATSPSLTNIYTSTVSATSAGVQLVLGDFNGDGFTDILTKTQFIPNKTTFNIVYEINLNDRTGKPNGTPINITNTVGDLSILKAADFDNDGVDDLIMVGLLYSPQLFFSKSNLDGTTQPTQLINLPNFSGGNFGIINIGSYASPSIVIRSDNNDGANYKYEFFQNTLDLSTNSTTTLTINPTNPLAGQAITFTATVTGKKPGGLVNFSDGATSLGSAPLVNGQATITLAAGLANGVHNLTASFPGDFRNKPSSVSNTVSIAPIVTLPKLSSVSNTTVKEGQKAKFKVSFSAATTEAASVRVTLLDGTTSGALDYSTTLKYSDDNGMTYQSLGSGGTAGVRAGATSLLIQVDTLKDNINEPTETFNLSVEPLSGLASDRGWAVGTILNKSAKHNSMFDQVRSIRDEVARKSDSVTSSIRNWVSMSVFSRLFSWR